MIKIGKATIHNMDCMELLKATPDKFYDLAIIDPPYGIGNKFKGGKTGKMNFNQVVEKGLDVAPSQEYFNELSRTSKNQIILSRTSKNQIIWGGNYFDLPPTRCFIVWDKMISEDFSLAMAELAWTSFDKLAKIYKLMVPKDGKDHPTQKPIKLYEWLLTNYAKQGDKILDTHCGSGSIAIACNNLGFELTACELDKDYYEASIKRIKQAAAQERLFS